MTVPASIVIPTRARLGYLEVALRSIAPQAAAVGAELLVVDDGVESEAARRLVESHGARYLPHGTPRGLNVARNTGASAAHGELVVFTDDDVEVREGWLTALLEAARDLPEVDVFTGPLLPRLEGTAWPSCGREGPPITSLYLGEADTDAPYAWGANMTIRASALARVGPFDPTLNYAGDEQEWQDRMRAHADTPDHARVRYVAAAAVDHRRAPSDARLRPLVRAARGRGAAARRFDTWRNDAPSLGRELLTLAGCAGHVVRYRCPAGLVMMGHSAGRVAEALKEWRMVGEAPAVDAAESLSGGAAAGARDSGAATNGAAPDDFLSGASGTVGGLDARRRRAADAALDARELLSGRRAGLGRAAARQPPRRSVLALSVRRPENETLTRAIDEELQRSRHDVHLHCAAPEGRGKFERLNELLDAHPAASHDWLLVIDDDVVLARGFLDRFVFLAERFDFDLAQPAHRLHSHAAWQVTRRQPRTAARQTAFVEIGPVTAFSQRTFGELLPFPALRMGWGLDVHWAALARERGWRCGVIDAVPVLHAKAPAAAAYSREAAVAEARAFLRERPYLPAVEAGRTLVTHRRW